MRSFLDFEKPIAELEAKIGERQQMQDPGSPWQKAQVARHPDRPKALACLLNPLKGRPEPGIGSSGRMPCQRFPDARPDCLSRREPPTCGLS